jgi:hypothetical protein
MTERKHRRESGGGRKTRAERARGIPVWLRKRADLDQIARARVVMILEALSGVKSVSTLIAELGISRGLYYQLETKAVNAMMLALAPGSAASASPEATGYARRIEELERQLARAETERRRAERLLFTLRKTLPRATVKEAPGRPSKRPGSTNAGSAPWRGSPRKATTPAVTSATPSTPTPAGATEGR